MYRTILHYIACILLCASAHAAYAQECTIERAPWEGAAAGQLCDSNYSGSSALLPDLYAVAQRCEAADAAFARIQQCLSAGDERGAAFEAQLYRQTAGTGLTTAHDTQVDTLFARNTVMLPIPQNKPAPANDQFAASCTDILLLKKYDPLRYMPAADEPVLQIQSTITDAQLRRDAPILPGAFTLFAYIWEVSPSADAPWMLPYCCLPVRFFSSLPFCSLSSSTLQSPFTPQQHPRSTGAVSSLHIFWNRG